MPSYWWVSWISCAMANMLMNWPKYVGVAVKCQEFTLQKKLKEF
ncbi:hypothetical protein HDF15_000586 [Granulicella mallensis]|uniref:Uncharacterized protein n=1 Tax=Granulicella mallensis TaxID=940614 RepID=A0A7W7ZLR3_9BACT|nr:hypothetical protein [Granulicella mallensis]